MSIILNTACNVQYKADKARAFKGVHSFGGGVDLMIVDIPEGSSHPHGVLSSIISPKVEYSGKELSVHGV
jgi:hypothetical protein